MRPLLFAPLLALALALGGCGEAAQTAPRPTQLQATRVVARPTVPLPTVVPPTAVPTVAPPTPTPPAAATLGQTFPLRVSQSATVGEITLVFDGVLQDSRCPKSVSCVWSGLVEVAITAKGAGAATQSFTFTRPSIPKTADRGEYAGYTIQLLEVAPYPETPETTIGPGEYVVTLLVEKK